MRATRRPAAGAGPAGLALVVATVTAAACGTPPAAGGGGRPTAPTPGTSAAPAPTRPASAPATGGSVTTPDGLAGIDPVRDITDLTPVTRGLRLGRPVNGVRHGELVLVIRNNGPAPVLRLMFTVEVPESVAADGGDWTGCTALLSRRPGFPAGARCDKGRLGVGESRSFRLGMRSPAAADGADSRVSRWLTDVWSAGAGGEYCQDAAPEDNRRIFSVYRD